MSTSTVSYAERRLGVVSRLADFAELAKPRIMLLVLVTVAVGAIVGSWGRPPLAAVFHTLVGVGLVAASASTFNQWLERRSDALMPRTANRPLPTLRMAPWEAWTFGLLLVCAGLVYLVLLTPPMTAALTFLTWVLYVVVYTPLKPRTPFNTAVGAVAGGLPVLIGWAAVGGDWNLGAAALFLILYLWQFPHFMAICWIYRNDYAAAGLRMLSTEDPTGRRAGGQAVTAALTLAPVSMLPATLLMAGPVYLLGAILLNALYVTTSVRFFLRPDEARARDLLRASLVYLPALLILLGTVYLA